MTRALSAPAALLSVSLCAVVVSLPGCDACAPADDTPVVRCEGCTVFQGGRVFDGSSVTDGLAVVVQGDEILAVRDAPVRVDGGSSIDTTGQTLLPGLIDAHVHLSSSAGPYGDFSDHTRAALAAMLRSGVTSALDLGSPAPRIFDLRARLEDGQLLGPRLFAAGPIHTPTGGHPCRRGTPPGTFCAFIDGLEAVDRVEVTLASAPDVIKIAMEGGSGFANLPRFAPDVLAAMVARAGTTPVILHAGAADDVRDGLAAGARLFAHAPADDDLPGDVISALVAADAIVVPTRQVFAQAARIASGTWSPSAAALDDNVDGDTLARLADPDAIARMTTPAYRDNALRLDANNSENLGRLVAADVLVAAGTDAGNPGVFWGIALVDELASHVQAGMTPARALASATQTGARLLGRDDLGVIQPGARADLLLVDGDPTVTLSDLTRVAGVWARGAKVDRAALAVSRAPDLTRAQLPARAPGDVCVFDSDCEASSTCSGVDDVCVSVCDDNADCPDDAICAPDSGAATGSSCFAGDGCDPLEPSRDQHACDNEAACTFIGDGLSRCFLAVDEGTQGQPCVAGLFCAEGYQCLGGGTCAALCDPARAPSTCAVGLVCQDDSALAGLAVGHCTAP